MLRTVANGDPAPENHAEVRFGLPEVRRKLTTPSTKNDTAPKTHVAIPAATCSNPQPIALPVTDPADSMMSSTIGI